MITPDSGIGSPSVEALAICQTLAEFGILDDLDEFLIEENIRLLPVNFGIGEREVKGNELWEVTRNCVIPRNVVVLVACFGLVVCGCLVKTD